MNKNTKRALLEIGSIWALNVWAATVIAVFGGASDLLLLGMMIGCLIATFIYIAPHLVLWLLGGKRNEN